MAQVLERDDIYRVYRPRVEEETVEGFEDVQRTFMILSPRARGRHRLIVLGQKRLPEARGGGQRVWGLADRVGRRPDEIEDQLERVLYATKTRGVGEQLAARSAFTASTSTACTPRSRPCWGTPTRPTARRLGAPASATAASTSSATIRRPTV
jgi:hypothetical protein